MDYIYENLGDERFQELCQAVLLREHPDVQCFPVGQPDGGRDATIAFTWARKARSEFSVYQVKYVRRPQAEQDPHKWLVETMAKEADKVKALIPRGAKKYFLMTNVLGTGHPETGSIDRLSSLLNESLGIPAMCLWRDDINRRIDGMYDLKWAYPEIMSGPDMLRLVIEQGLREEKERRTRALRAFLRAQYEDDEEVRFKQIELQNRLLDLYVDVPLCTASTNADSYAYSMLRNRLAAAQQAGDPIGAATLLLSAWVQQRLPEIVLEGAPGQGKSTVGQYVCQVHRMRLLQEDGLSTIAAEHQQCPIRLPFRIDLRDFATWLDRKDPFVPDDTPSHVPTDWAASLESFLAHQISSLSGGAAFTVNDLHAVASLSSMLLYLDGLDEIADVVRRAEVVRQIVVGTSRIKQNAASLQVIVTSRPTAFGPSVQFPTARFPHVRLDSLSKARILEYAEKWIFARKLRDRDAAFVRRVLKQKIDVPHLRDLARNPMQLAILLSLIRSKGESLPEKRTSLYTNYIELFFDRESEKSVVVMKHRELLMNLHGYLAWVLHSQSETGRHGGAIAMDELRSLVNKYIVAEEQDTSIITDLFQGVVERIVFLVSRVEGTLEFEVQPLREYFAGVYLYETAPHSPVGAEKRGTKPDRFDGIAAHPYWLNVTRFFSGSFSKGELPSLVSRIREMSERGDFRYTNYPRRLAALLLSDWVFSQDQRSRKEAVALVLDGIGIRKPFAGRGRRGPLVGEESLVLPAGSGREETAKKCMELLASLPPSDRAVETTQLLRGNATTDEIDAFWRAHATTADRARLTAWLRIGLYLGSLSRCGRDQLRNMLGQDRMDCERASLLLEAGQHELVELSSDISPIVRGIVCGEVTAFGRNSVLFRLATALNPNTYAHAVQYGDPRPLRALVIERFGIQDDGHASTPSTPNAALTDMVGPVIECAEKQMQRSSIEWRNEVGPWNALVEVARRQLGERGSTLRIANLSALVRGDGNETVGQDLLDQGVPLCLRMAAARRKANAHRWWEAQMTAAKAIGEKELVCIAFGSWAGLTTVARLLQLFESLLEDLLTPQWRQVFDSVGDIGRGAIRRVPRLDELSLSDALGARVAALLCQRCRPADVPCLFDRYLADYAGKDPVVLEYAEMKALRLARHSPGRWPAAVRLIERNYSCHPNSTSYRFSPRDVSSLTVEQARSIAANHGKYPRALVYAAEERIQSEIERHLTPVSRIAAQEEWFQR